MALDFRSSCGDAPTNPADAPLCGHSAEDFAEAAFRLEPRGIAWCKKKTTIKAAIYRAFGVLLSDFEQRICDLFNESLACGSVELLEDWEREYGLPSPCLAAYYPTDVPSRQALVCAARRGSSALSLSDLETLIRDTIDCPELTLTVTTSPNGVCISGITNTDTSTCSIVQHATVGGWTGGVGKPLQYGAPPKWNLLVCLLDRYLPSHIYWYVCPN